MRRLEIELIDSDGEKSLRGSAAMLLKALLKGGSKAEELRHQIWPAVAGKDLNEEECLLRVVPLHRLGADEGKSSASVFVAYFVADNDIWPSHPLIVKLAKPKTGSSKDECMQEFNDANSLKNLISFSPAGYAAPLLCHGAVAKRPYSVLWSPFAAADNIWANVEKRGNRLNLRIDDVWKMLTRSECESDAVQKVLGLAFESLRPVHLKGGQSRAEVRDFATEYAWYLRNVDLDGWSSYWRHSWGADDEQTASDFGKKWPNPFNVLRRILACEAKLFCGGIHGDLHPKNIVISRDMPRIIDFGWARDDAHIAKDFVLLECNLRFVTLPASMPYGEVSKLAAWLSFEGKCPRIDTPELNSRLQLIRFVRSQACEVFPPDTDWDTQYVVPMFLVAIGLLKYSDDFSSQVSARHHILRLAKYISQKVLPRYE